VYKFIACILLLNTFTLLPMLKFVCCGTLALEEKKQHPVLIKQVFEFEVRTSTNPNSSIRIRPVVGEPGCTFRFVRLAMGPVFLSTFFDDSNAQEKSSVASFDITQDPHKIICLKKYRNMLIDKLKELTDNHYPSSLSNCKGTLTVTCPPNGLYGPDSKNHTYEIELKETALQEEEHKNND